MSDDVSRLMEYKELTARPAIDIEQPPERIAVVAFLRKVQTGEHKLACRCFACCADAIEAGAHVKEDV